MAHLGIDLGTSNTLVAWVTSQGNPEVLRVEGSPMVPSAVAFVEDGQALTGKGALDMWAEPGHEPHRTFRRWKLMMGEEASLGPLRSNGATGAAITPELLTTLMVEDVLRRISDGLGGEVVESVLVTVPHGWRRLQPEKCRATRQAAERAKVEGQPVRVQPLTISEPVAAAAYWIWAYNRKSPDGLEGQSVLVCDIGGGTFDLSLIRVGGASRPLEVADAANNNVAGDFTDALFVAEVCRQFNRVHGTAYPEGAEEVLAEATGAQPRYPWLRRWMLDAQNMKHTMCSRLHRSDNARPYKQTFTDPEERHHSAEVTPQSYYEVMEPFFAAGRDLVRGFLQQAGRPSAVVFCGGGSNIAGVRERVVAPVLGEIMPQAQAREALERIPVNQGRADEAIALGAALISNGIVKVEERLLCDIGLRLGADANTPLPALLGLPPGCHHFFLTPLLSKGASLPAGISNRDLGLISTLESGEALELAVLVDDNPQDPWFQSWELPASEMPERVAIDWQIEVDAEGVLAVTVQPRGGGAQRLVGQVERKSSGRASIIVGPRAIRDDLPRISPDQLRDALGKLAPKDPSREKAKGGKAARGKA